MVFVSRQVLQELQGAAPLLSALRTRGDDKASTALHAMVRHWKDRLSIVGDSPQYLEPIVAVRTALLRMTEHTASHGVLPTTRGDAERAVIDEEVRELRAMGLAQAGLRLAKSARTAGHFETANHALAQAGLHDTYSAGLFAAKMAWESGQPHEAILRLQQQRKSLECLPADGLGAPGVRVSELKARYVPSQCMHMHNETWALPWA